MRAIRIAGHLFHVDFEYILGCALNLPYLNGFSAERSNANGAGAIGLRLRCGGRTAQSLCFGECTVGATAPKAAGPLGAYRSCGTEGYATATVLTVASDLTGWIPLTMVSH